MLLRSHSINADDTESELAAIPESPKSDSTLHGSSGGSLGELEDTVFKHTLHEPRMSITDGTTGATEPNNRNAVVSRARAGSFTKPMWFIGNEDEAYQVRFNFSREEDKWRVYRETSKNAVNQLSVYVQGNKSGPSKKWGVYEGMKMMVTGTLMAGQQELPKPQAKITAPTAKNGKKQLPYNGDNVTKSFDLSSAFAVATSISHIQR